VGIRLTKYSLSNIFIGPTAVASFLIATNVLLYRYWMMNCSPESVKENPEICLELANKLYGEVITIPYMAKFVVFAKRRDAKHGLLRVFVVTDDNLDKTLESHDRFLEVSRSDDVEVRCRLYCYLSL